MHKDSLRAILNRTDIAVDEFAKYAAQCKSIMVCPRTFLSRTFLDVDHIVPGTKMKIDLVLRDFVCCAIKALPEKLPGADLCWEDALRWQHGEDGHFRDIRRRRASSLL